MRPLISNMDVFVINEDGMNDFRALLYIVPNKTPAATLVRDGRTTNSWKADITQRRIEEPTDAGAMAQRLFTAKRPARSMREQCRKTAAMCSGLSRSLRGSLTFEPAPF